MSDLSRKFFELRSQFPALTQKVHKQELVYLDTAATSLKPKVLVDRIQHYYLYESANVHRGAHFLSDQATVAFEASRANVAKFINAKESDEIIFVRGTTEGVNLVAFSYGLQEFKPGDEIILTELEHHANIVPWQILAERQGLVIKVVQIKNSGELDLEDFKTKLSGKTKMVAVTGCSNSLGVMTDLEKIISMSHQAGAKVLVDAAQLVSQAPIDVQKLDCDFLVFSGHKLFGPTGIGIVYGKKEILNQMPPYQGGGSMISKVTFEKTTYHDVPFRFEAGTPHIEGVIGLHAAIDFFTQIGYADLKKWEHQLLQKATEQIREIPGITIYGDVENKAAILSFNILGAHPSDVGQILDQQGIAIRCGHHCNQPLMQKLGVTGTVRASFSIYNNLQDVEKLVKAVIKAQEMLI